MKKLIYLILTIIISALIAGLYGIFHDQITYTICPEYYTKFKFYQFNLTSFIGQHERIGAVIVGFLATWWVGLFIGLIVGCTCLLFKDTDYRIAQTKKSIIIIFIVTIIVSVVGGINYYSKFFFYTIPYKPSIELPSFVPIETVINHHLEFTLVGTIHNYSYLGGFIGLIIAESLVFYSFFKERIHKRYKKKEE